MVQGAALCEIEIPERAMGWGAAEMTEPHAGDRAGCR